MCADAQSPKANATTTANHGQCGSSRSNIEPSYGARAGHGACSRFPTERTIAMHLDSLIDALSRPDAYPHAVGDVDVRQTHISAVFLAGPFAYKLKKPVNLGFLDFSTLAQRDYYCHEEVRLNRRLAPPVYFGVVPVTKANGRVAIDRPVEF